MATAIEGGARVFGISTKSSEESAASRRVASKQSYSNAYAEQWTWILWRGGHGAGSVVDDGRFIYGPTRIYRLMSSR